MVMNDNDEFETKKNNIETKDKFELQHIHGNLFSFDKEMKFNNIRVLKQATVDNLPVGVRLISALICSA